MDSVQEHWKVTRDRGEELFSAIKRMQKELIKVQFS